MKFGNNRQNQFYYDTQEIENVESFKYLGHVLTNKRNLHKRMTAYLVTQAQKALFALQSDTKQTLGHITPKYILPILEYN